MEKPAVNPGWRKSSYSNGSSDNCVETAYDAGSVLVRDAKDNAAGPVLRVTSADWRRFTSTVRADNALS
jgi:hypothetical protein